MLAIFSWYSFPRGMRAQGSLFLSPKLLRKLFDCNNDGYVEYRQLDVRMISRKTTQEWNDPRRFPTNLDTTRGISSRMIILSGANDPVPCFRN